MTETGVGKTLGELAARLAGRSIPHDADEAAAFIERALRAGERQSEPVEVHVVVRYDGRVFGVYADHRQAYKDHAALAGARIVPATMDEPIRGGR